MKKLTCILFLLAPSLASAYTIVSTTTTQVADNLERMDWVVAPSSNSIENFSMHRVESTHYSNLGAFTVPVLAIGGGHGFGQIYGESVALFDHYTAANRLDLVEKPVLSWLRAHVF